VDVQHLLLKTDAFLIVTDLGFVKFPLLLKKLSCEQWAFLTVMLLDNLILVVSNYGPKLQHSKEKLKMIYFSFNNMSFKLFLKSICKSYLLLSN
jgi:hypothetical protein